MKSKIFVLLMAICMSVPSAKASHVIGMHITYQYTGTPNTYIFRLKIYRDCFGISMPPTMVINFTGSNCGTLASPTLYLVPGNPISVPLNPCAGVGNTYCQGGTVFGFEEYNYEGVVNVPNCANWIVSCSMCCRNSGVSNIINPDFYDSYVETKFDNLNYPGNSSPAFNGLPVNYYCAGIASLKDYSAMDIDGDSLSYELVPVETAPNVAIPMVTGFTYTQPLASFVPTDLDPYNGMLLFTPSGVQIAAVGYLVKEYRNGILIGTVKVDDEIVVTTPISNPDTVSGRVYYDLNSNGMFDVSDYAVSNKLIQLQPGNLFSTTSGSGKYEFFPIDGTWNITPGSTPPNSTINPSSIILNTVGITSSVGNDFILELVPNVNDLRVNLTPTVSPVPGNNYNILLSFGNYGSVAQTNATITVVLDGALNFVSSVVAPASISGDTLTWLIPSLPIFFNDDINILTTVDTTAVTGSILSTTASIVPVINDVNPQDNFVQLRSTVVASYDPNYKEVTPSGDLSLQFVNSQSWLTYRVHFQNTGNAPAQIVRIEDYLDTNLDFASLEYVTSSFPCVMTFSYQNRIQFEFFGINLPDSNTNEPASHGFVEYRIKPKTGLALGTYITNSASIYFDFNAPIYTNMVYNKVVTTVGMNEPAGNTNNIILYPNPTNGSCILEINSNENKIADIEIYNVTGSVVKRSTSKLSIGINRIKLPVEELSAGNYFVLVRDDAGRNAVKLSVVKP